MAKENAFISSFEAQASGALTNNGMPISFTKGETYATVDIKFESILIDLGILKKGDK